MLSLKWILWIYFVYAFSVRFVLDFKIFQFFSNLIFFYSGKFTEPANPEIIYLILTKLLQKFSLKEICKFNFVCLSLRFINSNHNFSNFSTEFFHHLKFYNKIFQNFYFFIAPWTLHKFLIPSPCRLKTLAIIHFNENIFRFKLPRCTQINLPGSFSVKLSVFSHKKNSI